MTKHLEMSGMIATGMRVARVVAMLAAGLALTACPDSDLPLVQPCEANNTANVAFTNSGLGGGPSLYAEWDGADLTGPIAEGATSSTYTVSAGSHTLTFRDASTNAAVCSQGTQTVGQCTYTQFYCLL